VSSFPGSPRLLKGGIVLVEASSGAIQRIVPLQYNPDSITRTLQARASGTDATDRSEATRLKGPPVETMKLEAELDAADLLEAGDDRTVQVGLHPQIAALESAVYPTSAQLVEVNTLAASGTLEIAPMLAPLTLFVWSQHRIVPVRITDFSVTEEAFDPQLNPIRARVSLGFRVLSVDDLGFGQRGGTLFMAYLQGKERLAARSRPGTLGALGLTGLP
jgi:hypothetical protein